MGVVRFLLPVLALLLCPALAPSPADAQMSPPPGLLTLPKSRPPADKSPAALPSPPQAAPVAPVQQVAPSSTRTAATKAKSQAHAAHASKPNRKPKLAEAPRAAQSSHAEHPAAPAAAAKPAAVSAASAAPARAAGAEPEKPAEAHGSVTNLPLPRWASLRADEVNLRVGPGMRFPIEWEYHRRDLPVEILREVEVWRLIEDEDGVKGWVHQATLKGQRGFIVKVPEAVMRSAASDDASPVARLKDGVVGRIRTCAAGSAWCEVQVADYSGWLRRTQIFGTDPGEAVGN